MAQNYIGDGRETCTRTHAKRGKKEREREKREMREEKREMNMLLPYGAADRERFIDWPEKTERKRERGSSDMQAANSSSTTD